MARRRGRRGRDPSLLGNLLLLLLSCVVGLALAEGAAWLIQPPPLPGLPQGMLEVGPGHVWRLTPNFSGEMDNRTDFRQVRVSATPEGTRAVPGAPAEAEQRLLVIGDSQTFGHGLSDDDAWPTRLQAALSGRGLTVKVVNMGVPGVNIDQYEARVRLLGEDIRPTDMVLFGISWNDLITPPSATEANRLVEGYLVRAESAGNMEEARARVRFFQFTGIAIPPLQNLKDVLDALSHNSALAGLLYPRAKAIYYRLRSHSPVAGLVKDGVPEANVLLMRKIADLVADRGARSAFVLLPERMFFEDEAYAAYSVDGREFPTPDYMDSLARPFCDRLQLTCLNAFPLLHQHQGERLVFKVDGHYNPKGAALLGPWLAEQLYP